MTKLELEFLKGQLHWYKLFEWVWNTPCTFCTAKAVFQFRSKVSFCEGCLLRNLEALSYVIVEDFLDREAANYYYPKFYYDKRTRTIYQG